MFGEDANWGRILCAIGYTDAEFEIDRVAVSLSSDAGSVHVCENGAAFPSARRKPRRCSAKKRSASRLTWARAGESATAWGCDLTYDYVKINGDYCT